MAQPRRRDEKLEALREEGSLNPRPERVQDKLFVGNEFFDARDLIQVKYEMVRRVETDGLSVTEASTAFGFSRPSFYQAQALLNAQGLAGLLPKKRGPRGAHKLNTDVVDAIEKARAENPSIRIEDLIGLVKKRFGVRVHARSIERALARREKKHQ